MKGYSYLLGPEDYLRDSTTCWRAAVQAILMTSHHLKELLYLTGLPQTTSPILQICYPLWRGSLTYFTPALSVPQLQLASLYTGLSPASVYLLWCKASRGNLKQGANIYIKLFLHSNIPWEYSQGNQTLPECPPRREMAVQILLGFARVICDNICPEETWKNDR